jgi:hypothetical protein
MAVGMHWPTIVWRDELNLLRAVGNEYQCSWHRDWNMMEVLRRLRTSVFG